MRATASLRKTLAIACVGLLCFFGASIAPVAGKPPPKDPTCGNCARFLTGYGVGSRAVALAYYNGAGVHFGPRGCEGSRCTLAGWKTANGFDAGEDVSALYYNDRELGLAQEVHCKATARKVACYTVNYGAAAPADPLESLLAAQAHGAARDIYAIESTSLPKLMQWQTRFYVYSPDPGNPLVPDTWLDSEGSKYVSEACRACHGRRYVPDLGGGHREIGPAMLPFDPYALKLLGADPGSVESLSGPADPRNEPFRRLNALVRQTLPDARIKPDDPIRLLIDGWYAQCGGVNAPGCGAAAGYVPPLWAPPAGQKDLYPIARDFCRPCHIAQDYGNEFAGYTSLSSDTGGSNSKQSYVCQIHYMPNAERISARFWASDAPAVLSALWGGGNCPPP